SDSALRDSVDALLRDRMRDGSLEKTFRAWNVWNDAQARYIDAASARAPSDAGSPTQNPRSAAAYLPSLLRAAFVTLALSRLAMNLAVAASPARSCLALALAVAAGAAIAAGRVYGSAPARALLTTYVEVVRGTPVLL